MRGKGIRKSRWKQVRKKNALYAMRTAFVQVLRHAAQFCTVHEDCRAHSDLARACRASQNQSERAKS